MRDPNQNGIVCEEWPDDPKVQRKSESITTRSTITTKNKGEVIFQPGIATGLIE